MFIVSAKVTKQKLVAAVVIAGVLLCALIVLMSTRGSAQTTAAVPTRGIESNEDRLAFITSFGLDCKTEPLEVTEVLIPKTFDETFQQYNDMQIAQDFDLSKYKGKRVTRYTYEVVNYPDHAEGVRCNLLVYKKRIIGGDVSSVNHDGFMHGFGLGQ